VRQKLLTSVRIHWRTSHHWDARLRDFPSTFTGQTIHSHRYIDPHTPLELTGKRILVVGIGTSRCAGLDYRGFGA
jgi:hypothetical protein